MAQTMDEQNEGTTQEDSLESKRVMTRSVIAAFAVASATVATLPLPFKDAVMLSPIELAEINALASIYDIPQEESVHKILDAMAQLGLVSMAARGAISVLDKGIKLKVTTKVRSAAIAAGIVAGVGICSAYAFEQVYLGKRSVSDLGVARKIRESDAWKNISDTVSSNLQKVMKEDTIEGIKLSLSELAKTMSPLA